MSQTLLEFYLALSKSLLEPNVCIQMRLSDSVAVGVKVGGLWKLTLDLSGVGERNISR